MELLIREVVYDTCGRLTHESTKLVYSCIFFPVKKHMDIFSGLVDIERLYTYPQYVLLGILLGIVLFYVAEMLTGE